MTSAKPRPPLVPGETRAYPVLPLRDIVVFPHMIVPLFVGGEKSIKALEEVMRSDTFIMLATQKNASDDDPATDSIYEVGTLASVLQLLKLPDGTVKVLVEGAARAKVLRYSDRVEYYEADAVVLADDKGEAVEAEALARSVINEFEGYVKLNKKVSPEVVGVVQQIDDYAKLADTVASHLAVKIPDKQLILETPGGQEAPVELLDPARQLADALLQLGLGDPLVRLGELDPLTDLEQVGDGLHRTEVHERAVLIKDGRVGGVFGFVGRVFEDFVQFFELDELNRIFFVLKKISDSSSAYVIGHILKAVDLFAVFHYLTIFLE